VAEPALVTEYELEGPTRGADRAVLLAHGAGADMHAATLTTVSAALAAAGVPTLRFNFRYRSAGRNAPDRAPVLLAALREAAAELARRTKLDPERLVLGGRSMGGRMASMVVADPDDPLPALGLELLGYPLHPAGKPDNLRTEHFGRIRTPALFVSGTRDALAPRGSLLREIPAIPGPVAVHWLESADHGFKPLKASGLTQADSLVDAAGAVVDFVLALPAPGR
jgi:predicted alpha/beta-hydrolase family hydrolase